MAKTLNGMQCLCGKIAHYTTRLRFNGQQIDGWYCRGCRESYHNPEAVEPILLRNKLQKRKFNVMLSQVRSNLILRIPKEMSDALNLKKGESMECGLQNDREIVLRAAKTGE